MWESRRIEIPGEGCTSLPSVSPERSFVCPPCTSSCLPTLHFLNGRIEGKNGSFMAITSIRQAFRFENRWRVKKSSPKSGEVSDHSPQLTTMPNGLMKFQKRICSWKKLTTFKARISLCYVADLWKFILFFILFCVTLTNGRFILFEATFTSMHVLSVYCTCCIVL